jgi:hypothetical protein
MKRSPNAGTEVQGAHIQRINICNTEEVGIIQDNFVLVLIAMKASDIPNPGRTV